LARFARLAARGFDDRVAMSGRIQVAATSLVAGNGGIARLARLMVRALSSDEEVKALIFLDESGPEDLRVKARLAHASKIRFTLALRVASLYQNRFIYDFSGLARAHPRVPFAKRPFAVWMSGLEVWDQARPDRLRALRDADLLLAVSRHTRDRAQSLHGRLDHARVCWLGTEQDDAPAPAARTGPPTVLAVGRLDPGARKGHDDLVLAWPAVVARVPEARLVIVGGGRRLAHVRALARASSAASQIDVVGFVPERAMDRYWQSASVFALPSRGEGFGLVYAEAMRHGLPVIASVHDAGNEVNAHGVTGYNVDLDRRGDLSERIIELLLDDSLAREFGRRAHERWAEHFRFSAFRTRFLSTIRDFVA
jgi:phosphatidylinositol alpha-1,6-mannosyltransferase